VTASIGTPESAGAATASVAYVGGSITRLGVVGAHAAGVTSLWASYPIGGGTLVEWNTNPYYLALFEEQVARNGPPSSVWVQLAFKDREAIVYDTNRERLDLAARLLQEIRARVGEVPVYVSPMADYEPLGLCRSVYKAPAMMRSLARTLVEGGYALRGPKLPALDATEVSDGCHQSEAGQLSHGVVLAEFFP
jgi:hypothetical protein